MRRPTSWIPGGLAVAVTVFLAVGAGAWFVQLEAATAASDAARRERRTAEEARDAAARKARLAAMLVDLARQVDGLRPRASGSVTGTAAVIASARPARLPAGTSRPAPRAATPGVGPRPRHTGRPEIDDDPVKGSGVGDDMIVPVRKIMKRSISDDPLDGLSLRSDGAPPPSGRAQAGRPRRIVCARVPAARPRRTV